MVSATCGITAEDWDQRRTGFEFTLPYSYLHSMFYVCFIISHFYIFVSIAINSLIIFPLM